jgi:type 1 glutamine amidotransferase
LRGNSRLKSSKTRIEVGKQELVAIASALKENKGLVGLDLMHDFSMSDDTWGAICDSLKAHPAIEVLDLRPAGGMAALAPAVLKSQIQALVDMLKVDMSIHTIRLQPDYR